MVRRRKAVRFRTREPSMGVDMIAVEASSMGHSPSGG